jgi:hypothetical protein
MSKLIVDIAYSLGVQAFKNGKKCVPAADKDFEENCLKQCKEVGDSIPYSKAWLKGWHDANLGKHVDGYRPSQKYFQIMEFADNPVGANFFYVTESEKDEVIGSLKNNYELTEIPESEYAQARKQLYRKSFHLMTGHWLSDEELEECCQ